MRLGEFLQARRARVTPDQAGIPEYGTRRVKGLRREELADLAGVSLDYYVRLEQGRALNPSDDVLDAITRALRLDATERAHLYRLARGGSDAGVSMSDEMVRPGLMRLLESLDGVPAYVLGRGLNILAWNSLGSALVRDFGAVPPEHRNIAWLIFRDPALRALLPDWHESARETVGFLRLAAGRDPDAVQALADELTDSSPEFAALWADHDVREKTSGTKRFTHPVVGDLVLAFEALVVPGEVGQTLMTYTAEPGSEAATALQLLATWAASAESERAPAQRFAH